MKLVFGSGRGSSQEEPLVKGAAYRRMFSFPQAVKDINVVLAFNLNCGSTMLLPNFTVLIAPSKDHPLPGVAAF